MRPAAFDEQNLLADFQWAFDDTPISLDLTELVVKYDHATPSAVGDLLVEIAVSMFAVYCNNASYICLR